MRSKVNAARNIPKSKRIFLEENAIHIVPQGEASPAPTIQGRTSRRGSACLTHFQFMVFHSQISCPDSRTFPYTCLCSLSANSSSKNSKANSPIFTVSPGFTPARRNWVFKPSRLNTFSRYSAASSRCLENRSIRAPNVPPLTSQRRLPFAAFCLVVYTSSPILEQVFKTRVW